MSAPMLSTWAAAILAPVLMLSPLGAARAGPDDGIVRLKSAYSMPETL
jgi:hypothetical protein